MFKFLSVLLLVVSSSVYASSNCPLDVASSCFREKINDGHSRSAAIKSCRNVSNTCYMEMKKAHYSSKKAIKTCKNVSNNCYTDVTRVFRPKVSARACENINNRCYTSSRHGGESIRRSILNCEDVSTDCRLCGGSEIEITLKAILNIRG